MEFETTKRNNAGRGVRSGGQGPVPSASDPGAVLRGYMDRHGLKQTAQREIILEVFLDIGGHPSPEELHEEVRRKDDSIGLATIYRTLKLFAASGIAKGQHFGDGLTRYELKFGKKQHIHLICEQCGRNMEASSRDVERHYEILARQSGFVIQRYTTSLYGLCEQCAAARNK